MEQQIVGALIKDGIITKSDVSILIKARPPKEITIENFINANIIKDVTSTIKEVSPNAIIICVSNPLDVDLCYF